jgi:hypothetical protein
VPNILFASRWENHCKHIEPLEFDIFLVISTSDKPLYSLSLIQTFLKLEHHKPFLPKDLNSINTKILLNLCPTYEEADVEQKSLIFSI